MNHLRHITAALVAVALLLGASSSYGLTSAAAPTKMQIPFGNSAGGAYVRTIPIASQIGIQNGAASYTDGFPPLNFTPISAGGVPPFGQDMNGILRETTALTRWYSAGGPIYYDSVYQTAIGGYPRGSTVQSVAVDGLMWTSTVDNNLTDPDAGGAGWVTLSQTTGSFTATLTGCTTTVTKTLYYEKTGNWVRISFPTAGGGSPLFTCTSNDITMRITGLPAAIRPSTSHGLPILGGYDNGISTTVYAIVLTTGAVELSKGVGPTGYNQWTSSGTKGLSTSDFSYALF